MVQLPFCSNCGKENAEGAAFCPNCGRPFQGLETAGPAAGTTPPQSQTFKPMGSPVQRPTGVTILAALQIVGSLAEIAFGAVFGVFGVVIIVIGVLALIFGLALLSGRNWARILILIGAVLDIISIVGIIWGVILLWYFTRKHVVAYFKAPK